MAWTTPKTWVASAILTALELNTYLRDNTAYLKGLLDGTGSDTVKVPAALWIRDDDDFSLDAVAGGTLPRITLDHFSGSPDFLQYDRANNRLELYIANVMQLRIAADGKLTGNGFYDSGNVTVAGGTTSPTFSHGFSVRPRLIGGWWATAASSDLDDGSSTFVRRLASQVPGTFSETEPYLSDATATSIRGGNPTGGTVYMRVFAIK